MTAVLILALVVLVLGPLIGFFAYAGALSLSLRWLHVGAIRFRSVLWIAFKVWLVALLLVILHAATGIRSLWWHLPAECVTFIAFLFILRRYARVTAGRALGTYVLGSVLGVAYSIIGILILIIPVRAFVVSPFEVRGESMSPAYRSGDLLLVDKLTLRSHTPQRGDVAVVIPPDQQGQYYIKRVIALPGEEVQITNGQVFVSDSAHPAGHALSEPYLFKQADTVGLTTATIPVPEGTYFVLGDNRAHSNDSRYWGMLPASNFVGIVIGRIWPPRT